MPGFNAKWLTNDFKQQVKDAAAPTTGHSIGPLDVLFKRFNQDVRLTDRRLNLTIRYLAATQFNWTAGESTAGLRYWQSADFRQVHMHCIHCMRHAYAQSALSCICSAYSACTLHVQELEDLGVLPVAHPRGVDAVFASTTFHDDSHLVTDCAPNSCQVSE